MNVIQNDFKKIIAKIFKDYLTKLEFHALRNTQKSQKKKLNISDFKIYFILIKIVFLLLANKNQKTIFLDVLHALFNKKMENKLKFIHDSFVKIEKLFNIYIPMKSAPILLKFLLIIFIVKKQLGKQNINTKKPFVNIKKSKKVQKHYKLQYIKIPNVK